ncbi:nitroreductase family protein [Micromonospora sp. DT233]|uniref:nitroreductase family protein n=1 Tax=Micromonospora sp. DT233 TaxID=3393432 RepID=UPI003CE7F393
MTALAGLLRTRRSGGRITDAAPSDAELGDLLALAMNAPDHAALRPWRLVLLRGAARDRLGAALAAAQGATGPERDRAAAKPRRAPLLVGIVLRARPHPKVPEWEQLAAATAVVTHLGLLLHEAGWSSIWRTGPLLDAPPVRAAMDVAAGERLLGWLYVGRPDPGAPRGDRPPADPRPHLTVLAAETAETAETTEAAEAAGPVPGW